MSWWDLQYRGILFHVTYLEWQAKQTQPHRSFNHGTDQIFNVCCCYFTGISLNHIKRANLICCCCLWPKQMAASQYLWSLLGSWTIKGSGLLNSRVCLKNTRSATSRKRKRVFKKYRRIKGTFRSSYVWLICFIFNSFNRFFYNSYLVLVL